MRIQTPMTEFQEGLMSVLERIADALDTIAGRDATPVEELNETLSSISDTMVEMRDSAWRASLGVTHVANPARFKPARPAFVDSSEGSNDAS